MSAAAAAIPLQQSGKGWTAVPHSYFKRLFRSLTNVEMAVLGNILDDTVGKRGRPEWTRITLRKFAAYADCHVNAVARALDLLEAVGAIEARTTKADRRAKEYRALVESWDRVSQNQAAKIRERLRKGDVTAIDDEEDEDDEDEDVAAQAPQQAVMLLIPGWKEPRPVHLCKACAHRVAEIASGKSLAEPETTAKRKQTRVASAEVKPEIPTLGCDDSTAPQNGHGKLAAELQTFLEQRLAGKLHAPPPRDLVHEQARRLSDAGVPLEYFATRFRIREKAIYSYHFVPHLVDDCLSSYIKAREAGHKAPSAASLPEVDLVAAYRRHITNCTARLRTKDGYGEVIGLLAQIVDELPDRLRDLPGLSLHIDNIEAMMLQIAEDSFNKNTVARIDRAVAKQTKPYEGRLTLEGYEQTVCNIRRAEIFREAGLPRLSP